MRRCSECNQLIAYRDVRQNQGSEEYCILTRKYMIIYMNKRTRKCRVM